jgi:predicted Holliday junction resolvase-like endonuclease
VQFEPDRIVFVEFKTGSSRLSAKQKDIKDLVLNKKVEFREVRMNDDSS